MRILRQHDFLIALEFRNIIRTAVEHVLIIHAEIVALLHYVVILDRQEQYAALYQRQEIGRAHRQRIFDRIVVKRLHATTSSNVAT